MPKQSMPSYYEILGVNRSADAASIKAAYRSASKSAHPDKGGNAAVFQMVQIAYDTLKDPLLKSEYDRAQDKDSDAPGSTKSSYNESSSGSSGLSEKEVQDLLKRQEEELRRRWMRGPDEDLLKRKAEQAAKAYQYEKMSKEDKTFKRDSFRYVDPKEAKAYEEKLLKKQKRALQAIRIQLFAFAGAISLSYYLSRAFGLTRFFLTEKSVPFQIMEFFTSLGFNPLLMVLFLLFGVGVEYFLAPGVRLYNMGEGTPRRLVICTSVTLLLIGEVAFDPKGISVLVGGLLISSLLAALYPYLKNALSYLVFKNPLGRFIARLLAPSKRLGR